MTGKKALTDAGDAPSYGLSGRRNEPMHQVAPAAEFRPAVRYFPRQYTLPELFDPADSGKLTTFVGAAI